MNILYICADHGIPVYGSKGASVHVRELSEAFSRDGHGVTLVAPVLLEDGLIARPQQLHFDVVRQPLSKSSKYNLNSIELYLQGLGITAEITSDIKKMLYNQELENALLARFESAPLDFIYVRAAAFSMAGCQLANKLACPLIVELNAPIAQEQRLYRSSALIQAVEAAERQLLTNANAICCVSEALQHYVESLGVDTGSVHVLPNGVNPRLFNEMQGKAGNDYLDSMRLGEGPVIGFLGTLRPWHGMDMMPALVKQLKPKYPNVKLLVVGPSNSDLVSAFEQHGIASSLVFSGARPHHEIPNLLRRFDIAIASYSTLEHEFYFSPLKLFEYMVCKLPVVAARIGQISTIIDHKRTGWLYTPGCLDELVQGCIYLLENTAFAQDLGQRAQLYVQQNHTWDHNAKRIIAIAQQLK